MNLIEELESDFDGDTTVERATDASEYGPTAELTVHCEPHHEDGVRERLAELGVTVVFEPTQ